jgi:hypothetical protein
MQALNNGQINLGVYVIQILHDSFDSHHLFSEDIKLGQFVQTFKRNHYKSDRFLRPNLA